MKMLTGSLQTRLVFLFFSLILLTNSIFALVAVSREKIRLAREMAQGAFHLGNSLVAPAEDFFKSGSIENFKNILDNRSLILSELKVTLYDKNWWQKAGDEARIPLEGFPLLSAEEKITFRSGTGKFNRELFFPVTDGEQIIGAIGIGIPIVDLIESAGDTTDFLLILLINLFIGVVAAIIVARSILMPLSGLMEGIDAFGEGNYALRVETVGQGELRTLCETFNRMAATVQENVKENQMRNRMLDEKLQELWEIYEITRNMSFSLDLAMILEKLAEKAQTLSFSSNSQIILQNRISGKIEPVLFGHSFPEVKTEDYENCLNECFLEKKVQEKVSNGYSMIFVPLISSNRVQGVFFLAKHDCNEYSENTRRFLQTIAPVAASMIENARLYEELSEWNNNMKNILCSVSAGLCAIDRKGRLIINNEKFFRFFQLPPDDSVETISDFCRSLKDTQFAQQMRTAVEGFLLPASAEYSLNRIIRYKTIWHGEDGDADFEVRMMPLYDGCNVRGAVIVVDDVTEQKKFEQQMVESEKWAVLGRLAASVAHEIRNPLVAIRSLVEIIGENVSGDLKEHVEVILGEVFRLNRVVAELLSLVRPETARMQIADLNRVVSELLLLVKHEAAKNNICIRTSLPESEVKALIDTEKIKQAFLNIILNAIQAAGSGGEIEISLQQEEEMLLLKFSNNGPQIPEEIAGRIFEPFFTTKANGTGLGLAITNKIAQLHRGRIDVDSNENLTTFTFSIPREAC